MKTYKAKRLLSATKEPKLLDGFRAFTPVFTDPENRASLFKANCIDFLNHLADAEPQGCVDMIFADPPYFLSNGGISCKSGRMVSVNKGDWDKSQGPNRNHEFNRQWLSACQRVLKPNGTIWVSGTAHVIYSIGFAMQQLGYKILNDITWVKPNPPPNLSCRYFTHSAETVIWAAKNTDSRHLFHYQKMREMAGGKQMKSVWNQIYPPYAPEKEFGKHPTQKPLELLERILLANSNSGDLILDPFMGSGTTGVAAIQMGRRFVGVELEPQYIDLAVKRITRAIQNPPLKQLRFFQN
ncbi:MAG: site-specific DNA-methyltransferase [Elusimicrobia bacterium]|nr:site-specific DNA-methyltransferase [Elusimicrobiota bacterium]